MIITGTYGTILPIFHFQDLDDSQNIEDDAIYEIPVAKSAVTALAKKESTTSRPGSFRSDKSYVSDRSNKSDVSSKSDQSYRSSPDQSPVDYPSSTASRISQSSYVNRLKASSQSPVDPSIRVSPSSSTKGKAYQNPTYADVNIVRQRPSSRKQHPALGSKVVGDRYQQQQHPPVR